MDAAAIERSLELVAEHGDPADVVYRRHFAAYPEMEALFVRDTDGGKHRHKMRTGEACEMTATGRPNSVPLSPSRSPASS
jgi:hemoglobin-like flavoprotein